LGFPRFLGLIELRDQIKRFAVFEFQLAVLPCALVHHEAQQFPLLCGRLSLKDLRGPIRQIEQPRPVLNVILVGLLVPFDLLGQPGLLNRSCRMISP
jgi:hypothetical protein